MGPAPWRPYCGPGHLPYQWRWIFDYSGGQLSDWGAHLLDGAQWGSNTEHTWPVEVEGKGVFCTGGLYDTAKRYEIKYKYADGLEMIVKSGNPSLRFEGSDGWLFVSYQKMDAHDKSLLSSTIGPDEIHLYESSDHKGNFLDCIKSRSEAVSPAEIAQRSVSVGHLGVIAITLGQKLKWDPAAERFTNSDQANKMLARPMRSPWHL